MLVLGLDPGSRHFGWGVVSKYGTKLTHVAHGTIEAGDAPTFAERLVAIERGLLSVLAAHRPACASIESLFFAKDAQAASKLGHARGVALLVCARAELPIAEYAPTLVKRTVAGGGRADKLQVANMVRALLKLSELPQADAADALAIAVTHIQQLPLRAAAEAAAQRLAALTAASGRRVHHRRRTAV